MIFLNRTCGIIHRDLKGTNVFLSEISHGILTARVGDFSKSISDSNRSWDRRRFNIGSSGYMVCVLIW